MSEDGEPEPSNLECKRCGHEWEQKKEEKPNKCPECKSAYWDREKGPRTWKNQGIRVTEEKRTR